MHFSISYIDRPKGREANIHRNLNFRLGEFLAERPELGCESLAIGLERGPQICSECMQKNTLC